MHRESQTSFSRESTLTPAPASPVVPSASLETTDNASVPGLAPPTVTAAFPVNVDDTPGAAEHESGPDVAAAVVNSLNASHVAHGVEGAGDLGNHMDVDFHIEATRQIEMKDHFGIPDDLVSNHVFVAYNVAQL